MSITAPPSESLAATHRQWHRAHEAQRGDEHGFLAVTNLHWLSPVPQRFADAPGSWWSDDAGVHLRLEPVEELSLDGVALSGEHLIGPIAERGGVVAFSGRLAIEIARRGGRDLIRPRDPRNPLRQQYAGTPTYPPTSAWQLRGHYVAFADPLPTTVGSVADGLEHIYEAPGRIDVEFQGASHSLTVFPAGDGAFLLLFTDQTSGVTTYGANRALTIAAPGPDGEVVLDFNRAVNLPCAYTPHATCPLPPAENRLPFSVEAGEKLPHEAIEFAGVQR